MLRPTNVSEMHEQKVSACFSDFQKELNYNHTEEILSSFNSNDIRDIVSYLAFTPNKVLPKRSHRPTNRIEFVAKQIYLAYESGEGNLDSLLQFTLAFQEYVDIVDDLVDDDVSDEMRNEVYAGVQFLIPVIFEKLNAISNRAILYWTDRFPEMCSSWLEEFHYQPSKDQYFSIIEKQANLYSSVTGVAAIAAGASDETVSLAESIGEIYFKHEQFLLDLLQYEHGEESPWNAWHILADSEAMAQVTQWKDELSDILKELPDERAYYLRPLMDVDVEQWRSELSMDD